MHLQVTAGGQRIELDLPDAWNPAKVNECKNLIIYALFKSVEILNYAEDYLIDKLVPGAQRPGRLKVLLDLYFGLKPDENDNLYSHVLNRIAAALRMAKTGLQADVIEIVDIRETGGVAGVQLQCMGYFNSSFFEHLSGFVYSPITESVPKMFSNLWRPSSGVAKAEFRPKASAIHLNFEQLLKREGDGDWFAGAEVLIHEATHKFAHTADHKYFEEDSKTIMQRIDGKIRQRSTEDPEKAIAIGWKELVSTSYVQELMAMHAQVPSYWAENANSLSHLAVDIYALKLS